MTSDEWLHHYRAAVTKLNQVKSQQEIEEIQYRALAAKYKLAREAMPPKIEPEFSLSELESARDFIEGIK